ncbi:MAG: hypothetical protein V4517_22590 [Pseudomonadota bacterium]|jgi:hypothetical protein
MLTSGRILFGSIVVLTMLSVPVLAKSSGAKADDKTDAPACSAYEKALDGSWTPAPCQEIGSAGRKHRESRPASDDDASH